MRTARTLPLYDHDTDPFSKLVVEVYRENMQKINHRCASKADQYLILARTFLRFSDPSQNFLEPAQSSEKLSTAGSERN